jgi:hypothetical protein
LILKETCIVADDVDARQHEFGALHYQINDMAGRVLGYFCRKLHDEETQYPATDRDLLGIWVANIVVEIHAKQSETTIFGTYGPCDVSLGLYTTTLYRTTDEYPLSPPKL